MKIIKYSKTYKNISKIQEDYIKENSLNLKTVLKINKKYSSQIKRKNCKNCNKKINKPFFSNFKIKYSICKTCGHLNGVYENTRKFIDWEYSRSAGLYYDKQYSKKFDNRVKNIYLPKVNFLQQVIKKKIKLIDIGSGGGHFLKALEYKKIEAKGYEVSKFLVDFGNSKLKKNSLIKVSVQEAYRLMQSDKESNVVSLIGVMEHLEKPNDFIKSFLKSSVEYLYIAVPLFSLTAFLENVFPKVYPRHLSGDHTHLYTVDSLNYLAKKNNLKIVGEWWFGADFPDLYRSLIVSSKILDKKLYLKLLNKNLFDVIDQLQNVLDKNKICSEVHMIFKKK